MPQDSVLDNLTRIQHTTNINVLQQGPVRVTRSTGPRLKHRRRHDKWLEEKGDVLGAAGWKDLGGGADLQRVGPGAGLFAAPGTSTRTGEEANVRQSRECGCGQLFV